jgi:hypothetical protein
MRDTETETPDLWGQIAIDSWHATPCIWGRVATETDVRDGRAVFHLDLSEGQKSRPFALALPCCSILHGEDEREVPVIVIQVETSINNENQVKTFAGYRLLEGGNGICLLHELELLNEPDTRFAGDRIAH